MEKSWSPRKGVGHETRPYERTRPRSYGPAYLGSSAPPVRLRDWESNSRGSRAVATLTPNLGVALAESNRRPLYLRIFF